MARLETRGGGGGAEEREGREARRGGTKHHSLSSSESGHFSFLFSSPPFFSFKKPVRGARADQDQAARRCARTHGKARLRLFKFMSGGSRGRQGGWVGGGGLRFWDDLGKKGEEMEEEERKRGRGSCSEGVFSSARLREERKELKKGELEKWKS